jgi:hypothetical protein
MASAPVLSQDHVVGGDIRDERCNAVVDEASNSSRAWLAFDPSACGKCHGSLLASLHCTG